MLTKEHICNLLRAHINQRPRLEFGNYGDVKNYRAELRSITKDRADALRLLRAVELSPSITMEALLAAFPRAYSGRLTCAIEDDPKNPGHKRARLEYCTGQYWPTEYRKAAAAVLASALWEHVRFECMPKPDTKKNNADDNDTYDGLRAGDWIRRHFRREFGRSIGARWFN